MNQRDTREIDYAAARSLAEAEIRAPSPWSYPDAPDPGDLVILDDATLERPYGWVFFYDSRQHQKTGALEDSLIGNAPILVTRSGAVHVLGTAREAEWYLANFEATGDPHQVPPAVEAAEQAERQRERALRRAVAEALRAGWPALQAARRAAAENARNATTDSLYHLLEAGASDDGNYSRYPVAGAVAASIRVDPQVTSVCGRVTVPGVASAARRARSRYALGSTPQSFADSMRL